ncbi:MAG: hypothetical protein Ct9H300mP11_27710 [Chloroflexota bacterium]|nr:MAG: hypothetical protein Ct9H300mP11_27710 [Chloroflexota bacterium]
MAEFGIEEVAISHRIGTVGIGEISLVSPLAHRTAKRVSKPVRKPLTPSKKWYPSGKKKSIRTDHAGWPVKTRIRSDKLTLHFTGINLIDSGLSQVPNRHSLTYACHSVLSAFINSLTSVLTQSHSYLLVFSVPPNTPQAKHTSLIPTFQLQQPYVALEERAPIFPAQTNLAKRKQFRIKRNVVKTGCHCQNQW